MRVILRGCTVADGTGAAARRADIGINGGQIAAIGDLAGAAADTAIDCTGLVAAPGFVDHHQHGDVTPLVDRRCASAVAQGVTTAVIGNCGHGIAPGTGDLGPLAIIGYRRSWQLPLSWPSFAAYRDELGAGGLGINIAFLAAHGAIRLAVLGTAPRPATEPELRQMERLVAAAMEAGAVGLSTGLEYSPGRYAGRPEIERLARVAGAAGGVYASHIRNRAEGFVAAVTEALDVARSAGCPAVMSHLLRRPYAPPGAAERVDELIGRAREQGRDVVVDTFPDPLGPSPLASVVPPWVVEGHPADVVTRLSDPAVVAEVDRALTAGENFLVRAEGSASFLVTSSAAHPDARGCTIGELAQRWRAAPAAVICRLLADEAEDFYSVVIQHRFALESDLDARYRDPWCAFESDGVISGYDGPLAGMIMNRSSYGYTARVLGEIVRDRRRLTLEEAVRRLTSLPAAAVGLRDRGRLGVGLPADIVVFDPAAIADRSTDRDPAQPPAGISFVFVNGALAHRGSGRPPVGRPLAIQATAGRVLGPGG